MSEQGRIARTLERIAKTPGPWSIVAETAQDGSLAWAVRHKSGGIPQIAAGVTAFPETFAVDLYAVALGDLRRDVDKDLDGAGWIELMKRRNALRAKLLAAVGLKERVSNRTAFFAMADRYRWDEKHCAAKDGWVQIDTTQDAWYYGTWTHKEKRQIVNYCEGDLNTTLCADDEAYRAALREYKRWNDECGYWLGIDAGSRAEEWYDAGFGEYLHRFDREQIEAKRAGASPPDPAKPGEVVVRAKSANQLRALLAT